MMLSCFPSMDSRVLGNISGFKPWTPEPKSSLGNVSGSNPIVPRLPLV